MKVETFVRTGLDFGGTVRGGSGPAGILAAAGHVFVANANDDSVSVLTPPPTASRRKSPSASPASTGCAA